MDQPTQDEPEFSFGPGAGAGPEAGAPESSRPRDPLAVALANASLLSAGYVMLGRRRLAIGVGAVTLTLVIILASVAQSVGFEIAVLVWWTAVTAHGWYLAGGRLRRTRIRPAGNPRKQRLTALAITLPVLLLLGLLRFDAYRIGQDTADARRNGNCSQAQAALDRLWFGDRVADAPLAASDDDTRNACTALRAATAELNTALTGDTQALKSGFGQLSAVLAEFPGHEQMVETVLNSFLDRLPTKDACRTAATTDWLGARKAAGDVLDRASAVVPRIAPAALVGCGDELMATNDWTQARTRYQQLLDQYPDLGLAAKAKAGVTKATRSIEFANVTELLQPPYSGVQPDYCSKPAPYSGAAPYRHNGRNRALLFGNSEDTSKFPAGWRTYNVGNAVLVICAGDSDYGTAVQTCDYESKFSVYGYEAVTFHKIAIPIRAYELRTGRLVANTKVQISGSSCPSTLEYTTYLSFDSGPPSEVYVTPHASDVRAAFDSLINP